MEVNPDKGINVGSNPFYRPSNSAYGSQWQASKGDNPVKMGDIPQYPDVVSTLFNCIARKLGAIQITLFYVMKDKLVNYRL